MTADQLKQKLIPLLQDEVLGAQKYLEMSEDFEKCGNEAAATGFAEAAYDEFTHAHFMHVMLEEHCVDIPSELECSLEKLHEMFDK